MEQPIDLGQVSDKEHCLFSEKTTLDYAVYLSPEVMRRIRELAVLILFGSNTTAGSIVIETAPTRNYAGTWANVATINWSAADKIGKANLTGCYLWVRIRIATAVANGTADCYATAN